MPMRLSGLMSGMDTESIVNQLVEARKAKVTKTIKAQKSLGFKQEAWKSLNTQILKLYDGFLSNMRFSSSYMKKTTKVSNSSVASVITGEGAMNSVQELSVSKLAKSGYLTGGKIERASGNQKVSGDTRLSEIGYTVPMTENNGKGKIEVIVGGEVKEITVERATTVDEFVSKLRGVGVNANFDAANGRIHVSGKSTGTENDFEIIGGDESGWKALNALGLNYIGADGKDIFSQRKENIIENLKQFAEEEAARTTPNLKTALADAGITLEALTGKDLSKDSPDFAKMDEVVRTYLASADPETAHTLASWVWDVGQVQELEELTQKAMDEMGDSKSANGANKTDASDAEITLNGVTYTSSKNAFEVNGLTITVSSTTIGADGTDVPVTISTEDDTEGIYDMIRNFFKEYNELINQMDKLYNAESAKEYEPLTDEEKAEMSDNAIEEWEKKIKDSILRRDSSLNTISSAMKQIMMGGVEVNGRKMYLSNFGIETLSYFTAAENEKNAYHIDGDSEDSSTAKNADKLKSMIASDPDTVVAFFTKLSQDLYGKMTEVMGPTEYSSAYTAYDDKKMKTEYEDYKSKIKELEKKLADYEDQWYAKFAAMETAMAKMQRNASAVTSLLGGS